MYNAAHRYQDSLGNAFRAERTVTGTRRILLVDDDKTLLEMLSEQLSSDGEFETATADTAARALKLAKARQFDVIILDIGLPDIDGRTCSVEILGVHHKGTKEEGDLFFVASLVSFVPLW